MEMWLDFSEEFGQAGPPTTIRRWISTDTVNWTLDPNFAVREFATWRSLFYTGVDRYGVLGLESPSGPNAWFAELIESRMIAPFDQSLAKVCFWEYRRSPDRLLGFPCVDGSSEPASLVEVTENDLEDPLEAKQLFQCAVSFPYLGGGAGEVVTANGLALEFEASFASSATISADGTVIMLSPSETAVRDSGCESYLGDSQDELVLIRPTGERTSHPLPPEVLLEEMFGFPGGPSIMVEDGAGSVLILGGDGVHRFDLATAAWDFIPIDTTTENIRPGDNTHLMPGTPNVVVFDGEVLRWGSLYGELSSLAVERQSQYAVPLYLDEDRLFFQQEGSNLSVIEFMAR